jgi:hypothetical protein
VKTQVWISFGVRDRPDAEVDKILKVAEQPHPGHTAFIFDFDSESPRLAELRSLLRTYGVEWRERVDYRYSRSELLGAPLIQLSLERGVAGDGVEWGNDYDLSNACSQCGTGARPVPPFKLKASETPKRGRAFLSVLNEWFVAADVADRLRTFSDLDLLPTYDHSTGEALPWFELSARHELPPMDSGTTGLLRQDPCRVCDKDGYFGTAKEPLMIVYGSDTLHGESVPDAAHTYEHFGQSSLEEPFSMSGFAQPALLVKPALLEVLLDAKIGRLWPYPVVIQ